MIINIVDIFDENNNLYIYGFPRIYNLDFIPNNIFINETEQNINIFSYDLNTLRIYHESSFNYYTQDLEFESSDLVINTYDHTILNINTDVSGINIIELETTYENNIEPSKMTYETLRKKISHHLAHTT